MSALDSAVPSSVVRLPLPVLIATFCLLWSSAFAVAKLAMADCPPLILLTVRFLVAGLLILVAAAVAGLPFRLSRGTVTLFAVIGIANQAVYLGLGYMGMRSISSGLSALIISANPVLTALVASAVLGERMTRTKVIGLLLGIGGVAFIVQGRFHSGADEVGGILFTLAALVSLVIGTIVFKRWAPSRDLWVGNGVQSLSAGLALAPVAFTFEDVGEFVPTWRLAVTFSYLVLMVSVFGYLIWFHILSVSGATAASAYHFLMPPLGMVFGWLLLDERVEMRDLFGILPVALGIFLVTRHVGQVRRHTGSDQVSG
jgi:drug/metabolite transporter (DMT)-like permease